MGNFFSLLRGLRAQVGELRVNSPIDLRYRTSTFHAFSATNKRAEMQVSRDETTGPPLGPTLRKLRLVDHHTATEKSPGSRRSIIASRNLQSLRSYAANDTWLIVVKMTASRLCRSNVCQTSCMEYLPCPPFASIEIHASTSHIHAVRTARVTNLT